jgi:hypothetical protein
MAPNEVILMGAHGDVIRTSTTTFSSEQHAVARSAHHGSLGRAIPNAAQGRRC